MPCWTVRSFTSTYPCILIQFYPSLHWPTVLHIGQNNHVSVFLRDQFNQSYQNRTTVLDQVRVSSSLSPILTPVVGDGVLLFNLLDQSFTDPISSVSVEVSCTSETDGLTRYFSQHIPTDHLLTIMWVLLLSYSIGHLARWYHSHSRSWRIITHITFLLHCVISMIRSFLLITSMDIFCSSILRTEVWRFDLWKFTRLWRLISSYGTMEQQISLPSSVAN